MTWILLAIGGIELAALVLLVVLLRRSPLARLTALGEDVASVSTRLDRVDADVREELSSHRREAGDQARQGREELAGAVRGLGQTLDLKLSQSQQVVSSDASKLREELNKQAAQANETLVATMGQLGDAQKGSLALFAQQLDALTKRLDERHEALRSTLGSLMSAMTETTDKRLEALRTTVEGKLKEIQEDSSLKLERIRATVDEKLASTLETRLSESFRMISERLELVHRGLGEMQALATGVGDLKKVLSNVRSRGTWGEVQLGSMLEQVLTPAQYESNVPTKDGAERVEFAIKLPGRESDPEQVVWLPIDAKFPVEDYNRLVDAQERGDPGGMEDAAKQLDARIRQSGREIRDKYLSPPKTTDFGIMFLSTEGLFAEVARRSGLLEYLHRECRIIVAGPTSLWAILNSLQMGFRTLAIEKRSSDVWRLLAAIKTEWAKYGEILRKVQKKLQEASNTIEETERRTRVIGHKLREVQELPPSEASVLLGTSDAGAALEGSAAEMAGELDGEDEPPPPEYEEPPPPGYEQRTFEYEPTTPEPDDWSPR